jgi:hypothetical protein
MIAPRTDRSWELLPNGMLVFERPPGSPGSSRALVTRTVVCTAPECTCREVSLVGVDIDGEFDDTAATSDELVSRLTSAEVMNAQLDIDLGSLTPDDYEGRVPLSDDWVRYARSQIDGDLLDLLHERWLQAKGTTSVSKAEWKPRPPDELVAWLEAHPTDREDLYLDQDTTYVAQDLYCVDPSCGCSEIAISFVPVTPGEPDVGMVRVELPTLEVVERAPSPGKAAVLDRLWSAFSARHLHLADRLSSRKKVMVKLAATRARPPTSPVTRSTARVGRNEPCPCGSGKKYKRCCGL